MPFSHGKTFCNIAKSTDRGSYALSKRSIDRNNLKSSTKERQVSSLLVQNSEQRCIIFKLVSLGPDAPVKFLVPIFLPVQGSSQGSSSETGAHLNVDALDILSALPGSIFHHDVQKEQNAQQQMASENPVSAQNLRSNTPGQSRKRNKRAKSVINSSDAGQCFEKSSDMVCEDLNAICPDAVLIDVPKVNKPLKKKSRKKGKKKGKRGKQPTHKRASTNIETQCEEGVSGASSCETSGNNSPACSREHLFEANLCERLSTSCLSAKYTDMEKDDSGCVTVTSVMASRSFKTVMDGSESSSSQSFSGEEFTYNQSNTDDNSSILTKRSTAPQSPDLSTCDENTPNGHLKMENSCGLSDNQHKTPMSDLYLDGWTCDASENCCDNPESLSYINRKTMANILEGGMASDPRINSTSAHSLNVDSCEISSEGSSDILDNHGCSEKVECSSQLCNSDNFHPVLSGKRARIARKLNKTLNGMFDGGKAHGWTGKVSNCSVWQKVRKNDANYSQDKSEGAHPIVELSSKVSDTMEASKISNNKNSALSPEKSDGTSCMVEFSSTGSENGVGHGASVASDMDNMEKASSPCLEQTTSEKDLLKAASNVDSSWLSCKSTDGGSIDVAKKKSGSVSKNVGNCLKKGSLASKTCMAKPSKTHGQQKEVPDNSGQVNQNNLITNGLICSDNCQIQRLFANSTNRVGSESLEKNPIHMEEPKPKGSSGNVVHGVISVSGDNQTDASVVSDDQISQFLTVSDISDEPHCDIFADDTNGKVAGSVPEDHCLFSVGKEKGCTKFGTGNFRAEYNIQPVNPGSMYQRWIPVARKDAVMYKEDNPPASTVDKPDPVQSNLRNEVKFHNLDPCSDSSLAYSDLQCQNHLMVDKARKQTYKLERHAHAGKDVAGVSAVSDDFMATGLTEKDNFGLNSDLEVIVKAVTGACELQAASEHYQLVSGSPVAEFERFLHFASPVLSQVDCIQSCNVCPQEKLLSEFLCPHQIPSVSLGNLWQWYEKPGSYGLEVKVEGYNNLDRSYHGCYGFHAYFVPYLSAIQLFGQSSNSFTNSGTLQGKETHAMNRSTGSTSLNSLPIFPKLLPKPRKEVEVCSQTVRNIHFCNGELIFEYFESGQPQTRRPFFQKIKELLRGDVSPNCQIFGDPSNLECRNLHDLHPASWFSVAWYPIYRIPDGSFRAAFLTYHSLGQFSQKRASSKILGAAASIISPVVGLQSYNAKDECWFVPRGLNKESSQTSSDPSEIVKERLRMLEKTASVMARASVLKCGQKSVNRQPDYEFFLSRRQ